MRLIRGAGPAPALNAAVVDFGGQFKRRRASAAAHVVDAHGATLRRVRLHRCAPCGPSDESADRVARRVFERCPDIADCGFVDCPVSDAGLEPLGDAWRDGRLTGLVELDLQRTKITSTGLQRLCAGRGLRPLRVLNVSQMKITDAGLVAIFTAGFVSLKTVHADNVPALTDALFEPLLDDAKNAPALCSLSLRGNRSHKKVTQGRVDAVKAARPRLAVHGTFAVPDSPPR